MTNVSMNNHESKTFRDNGKAGYKLTMVSHVEWDSGTEPNDGRGGGMNSDCVVSKRTCSDTPKFCIHTYLVGDEQQRAPPTKCTPALLYRASVAKGVKS